MKLPIAISALLGLLSPLSVESFVLSTQQNACRQAAVAGSSLRSTPSPEEMRKIMEEESTNPEVLSQSAAAMKNMTPQVGTAGITLLLTLPSLNQSSNWAVNPMHRTEGHGKAYHGDGVDAASAERSTQSNG